VDLGKNAEIRGIDKKDMKKNDAWDYMVRGGVLRNVEWKGRENYTKGSGDKTKIRKTVAGERKLLHTAELKRGNIRWGGRKTSLVPGGEGKVKESERYCFVE